MATIHKQLSNTLLEILPTNKDAALNVNQLKEMMPANLKLLSVVTIRNTIKELRLSWVPILWNNRWSYISYESNAINYHKETIDKMKAWFCTGMNKIKKWYDIALESKDIIS